MTQSTSPEIKPLRRGVLGLFVQTHTNQLMVCERSKPRGCWQFPQGGIDKGETADDAFWREMKEELGTVDFEVLNKASDLTQYEFPESLSKIPIAKNYRGQSHTWYLCKWNEQAMPIWAQSDGEFVDWKWLSAEGTLKQAVDWKTEMYTLGLKHFGLL